MSASDAVGRALALAAAEREVIEGQIITEEMPTRKELVLRGRAALADLGRDPDDWVAPATDQALKDAQPSNTAAALAWGWGRWIWWCGLPNVGRVHWPARPNSVRQYIEDHKTMRRPDGKLRGRYGQPYAPATVELAVYLISMIHDWTGAVNPVRHPKVADQLAAYSKWWENQGFRPDVAHALTPSESVTLARSCDLSTIGGLRNATMFRLQYDMGCRASELCHLQLHDLRWETPDRVLITISRSKTDQAGKGRVVGVEAVRDVDWDVDPVRLLQVYLPTLAAAGHERGPLFPEVFSAPPRKDGRVAGTVRTQEISYKAYEAAFNRAVRKSGVDRDPVTGKKRHVSTHSNRAGMITAAADAGLPLEKVAPRTGHSPSSKVINRYFRSGRRFGADNPGTLIRLVRRPEETPQATAPAPEGGPTP